MNNAYEDFYKNIIARIGQAKNDISLIKEKAILEIHWSIGEVLNETRNITEQDFIALRNQTNAEMKKDPLLRNESTNTHWLKLTALWVAEHSQHDKNIMLSGKITWAQWALLLDVVNRSTQRYWLACQVIRQDWDTMALLRAAQLLPNKYVNIG